MSKEAERSWFDKLTTNGIDKLTTNGIDKPITNGGEMQGFPCLLMAGPTIRKAAASHGRSAMQFVWRSVTSEIHHSPHPRCIRPGRAFRTLLILESAPAEMIVMDVTAATID